MARIQDKTGRSFIRNGESAEGYAHPVSASSLASVVGLAIRALMSHNMEWHFRVGSTVVAQDPYQFVLIKFRHWCCCNFHIKLLPKLRHITDRLKAQRASIL